MDILGFYIPDWIFVALNLLILVFFLNKILFKRVNAILDKRQEKINQALSDAEEIQTEKLSMEQARLDLTTQLDRMTAEQMTDARARAGREYDRIVAEAESKAQTIVASAKTMASRERENMLLDAQTQIASAALDAAGVLLEANMDSEVNRRLVESFLVRKGVSNELG